MIILRPVSSLDGAVDGTGPQLSGCFCTLKEKDSFFLYFGKKKKKSFPAVAILLYSTNIRSV